MLNVALVRGKRQKQKSCVGLAGTMKFCFWIMNWNVRCYRWLPSLTLWLRLLQFSSDFLVLTCMRTTFNFAAVFFSLSFFTNSVRASCAVGRESRWTKFTFNAQLARRTMWGSEIEETIVIGCSLAMLLNIFFIRFSHFESSAIFFALFRRFSKCELAFCCLVSADGDVIVGMHKSATCGRQSSRF